MEIEKIELDPEYQIHKDLWDRDHTETAMINSIKNDGLNIMPVVEIIEVSHDDYRYLLLSGHRRIAALKKLGEKYVECIIKRNFRPSDRLGFIIRYEMNHRNWSDDEKGQFWTKHYLMLHQERCGCDRGDISKCLYVIEKWSREMGVSKATALKYIHVNGKALVDIDLNGAINVSKLDPEIQRKIKRSLGKKCEGKHHLHVRCSEETKIKVILMAINANMDLGEYVLSKIFGKDL